MLFKTLYKNNLFSLCCFSFFFGITFVEAENFIPNKIEKEEIIISSKKASFDQKLGLIKLNEQVLLSFKDLIFESDEMTLIFENKENPIQNKLSNLEMISAKGNVSIKRGKEIIESNLATFFPKENKIKMVGNVKIIQGAKAGISSEILEIDLNSGTSSFSGNVTSKILVDISD